MTLEEIKCAMKDGDVLSASAALEELLASEPGNTEAKLLYGTCCHICGDEETFIRIDDEIARDPDSNHRRMYRKYHALRVAACSAIVFVAASAPLHGELCALYAAPVYGPYYCISYTARVHFQGGGGSGSMPTVVVSGDSCSASSCELPECGFSLPGYEFVGWRDGSYGGLWYPGDRYYVSASGDFYLTAQWEEISYDYTLTANSNGGYFSGGNFGVMDGRSGTASVTVSTGTSNYSMLGSATRSGYAFTGWWTARSGGTRVFDANGNCVAGNYWSPDRKWVYGGNVTLYAQWNEHGAVSVETEGATAGRIMRLVFHRMDGSAGRIAVKAKTQTSTGVCGMDFDYVKEVLVWEDGDMSDKTLDVQTYGSGGGKQLRVKLAVMTTGAYEGCSAPALLESKNYFQMDMPNPGWVYVVGSETLSVTAGETLRLRVRRYSGCDGAIAVKVKTQTSTGICGKDFDYVNKVLEWGDGDTSDRFVDIPTHIGKWDGTRLLRVKLSTLSTGAYDRCLTPGLYQAKVYAEIECPYSHGRVDVVPETPTPVAGDPLRLVFRRMGGCDFPVAVKYKVQTSTAVAGEDFEYMKGVVFWDNSEDYNQVVEVPTYSSSSGKQLRVKLSALTTGDYEDCVLPNFENAKVYVPLY